MAARAGSWPTTRSRRRSSMCSSFCFSPSSRRETGMPVHLLTTVATSSSATSRRSMAPSTSGGLGDLLLQGGELRRTPGGRPSRTRPAALACSSSMRRSSRRFCRARVASMAFFSCSHRARSRDSSSPSSASSLSSSARRSRLAGSFSLARAWRSSCSCICRRSRVSISMGRVSIWMRTREAASSMRSTALSGRNRSAM